MIQRVPVRSIFARSYQKQWQTKCSWRFNSLSFSRRGFSIKVDDDSTRNTAQKDLKDQVTAFVDISARGVGQVIFLNSQKSGMMLMGGLILGDPYLATMAALGTVAATGAAKTAGLDDSSIKDGLLGYNGCLVGCAAAVFGPTSILACTTTTVVGAAATPFVALSLKEFMDIPQWTFAFNFVTLTNLLRTRPLLPVEDKEITFLEELIVATESQQSTSPSFVDVIASPFTGISQIFVVESALSGAVITAGIASYSPMLAAHALCGSAIGTFVGAVTGAELAELTMGLYGFNSALTSMAVGVFFIHSTPTMVLSASGAAATASLFGAMKTVFGAYGAPALTLPFCFTMSACYVLHKHVPGLALAKNPHSPEKNGS